MEMRNFNEFANRAGSRGKTLLSLVRDVVNGNLPFTYRDRSALHAEWRPTNELTGQHLKRLFEPLRILPVLWGDKVLFYDQLRGNDSARIALVLLHEEAWQISSAA
jgi:hypothetical protein